MNLNNYKHIYFIGIGGIGMSAIARYFNSKNVSVSGYDKVKSDLCVELETEGISIHYNEDVENIPNLVKENKNESLIVYTPAISKNHFQYQYFHKKKYKVLKRAEVLGLISQKYFTIAVAGTHGKTTTSTMLAHILTHGKMDCTAFLGGISKNYKSNFLISEKENIIVVEADEYDKSFLQLNPDIAIITSVDADHLDVYGNKENLHNTFSDFADNIKKNGTLILENSIDSTLFSQKEISIVKYSAVENSDYHAKNISVSNGKMVFDVHSPKGDIVGAELCMAGNHNISNAIACISVSQLMGLSNDTIVEGIQSFQGIKRRFDVQISTPYLVFIDDYAHHPIEITESLKAVKMLHPNKQMTVVFQPHLYSRTQDFADDFAESLSVANQLVILDIYGAREKEIPGVSSEMLLSKCTNSEKEVSSKNDIVEVLEKKNIELLVTLGAGDISTKVQEIKNMLEG